MSVDLHCHSTASDGALTPRELVRRAAAHGVTMLALTDHDAVEGLAEAHAAAREAGIAFVNGVEISVTWRGTTLHVVGLRIDPANAALAAGLEGVRGGRVARARRIAAELEKEGIAGTFEGAMRVAGNTAMVSRTHFARHLVQRRVVPDTTTGFRRFLVPGKPGYVPHEWAALASALGWIAVAGGHAVLSHPGRYGLSSGAMNELLAEFRDAGGEAIEVVSASHSVAQCREFAELARHFGLAASRGSDFHAPGEGAELGSLPALDARLYPVWRDWGP